MRQIVQKTIRLTGGKYAGRPDNERAWRPGYVRGLAAYLIPPVRKVSRFLDKDRSSFTLRERWKVVPVVLVTHYAQIFELLRLGFGGKPRRR